MSQLRIATVAVIMLALLGLAASWPWIAFAQQQPSKCGAYASGIRADGSTWTGVAVAAGTATVATPVAVASPEEADTLFGQGSEIDGGITHDALLCMQ